jgi:DNA-binding IclR family transcriptional regulator
MSIEDSTRDAGLGAGADATGAAAQSSVEGAVPRALAVLETLARTGSPMRLTTLANELRIQKSTVHRILSMLATLDYVSQDRATGCYRASLKVWELGTGILAEHPVKRAAAGFLQSLHRETGETVSLLVRSGDDVLYLEKLVSPRPVRPTTRAGSRVPAVLAAGGKAMLAHDPDARGVAERFAAQLAPGAFDVAAFMRELATIQKRGYALSSFSAGVVSVGAPILGKNVDALAALSVSAPRERLTRASQARIVEVTLATCAEMAEAMGRP